MGPLEGIKSSSVSSKVPPMSALSRAASPPPHACRELAVPEVWRLLRLDFLEASKGVVYQ